MLDVDRGVDVDAGSEQFLNVLPTLGMPTAGRIGVRQFVDQHQCRCRLEQGIKVHFFEGHAAVFGAQQGLLRHAIEQRFGFRTAVGFHHARHDPDALTQLRMGRLKHGVGFAHARRGTEKNLQPPAPFAGQLGQQCISSTGITHLGYQPSLIIYSLVNLLRTRRTLLQLRVARCRR